MTKIHFSGITWHSGEGTPSRWHKVSERLTSTELDRSYLELQSGFE